MIWRSPPKYFAYSRVSGKPYPKPAIGEFSPPVVEYMPCDSVSVEACGLLAEKKTHKQFYTQKMSETIANDITPQSDYFT